MRLVAPILAYHSVHPDRRDVINVSPQRFAQQMQWLADHGFRGVSLQHYRQALAAGQPSAARMVAITFDDGYLDNYTQAWPILQRHHFTATIFVVPSRVGTKIVHDEAWLTQFPSVPLEAYAYMDWQQILSLNDAGIEIGSHTVTHPLLEKFPRAIRNTKFRNRSGFWNRASGIRLFPFAIRPDILRTIACASSGRPATTRRW